MNDLDQFPSMRCFGEQLDELAARDAASAKVRGFDGVIAGFEAI